GRAAFDELRERARQTVEHWCKHARIPVRFEGRDIRRPFEVASPCSVTHREEGTRIVAGLVDSVDPPYGYYNRGLTLEEGDEGPWSYVTFKIDSRYLEHTLTRDQVVEDEDFHKAHDRLESLIEHELPARLMDRLEETAGPAPGATHDRLAFLLSYYLRRYGEPPEGWRRRPIVPTVSGKAIGLGRAVAAGRRDQLLVYTGDRPEGVAELDSKVVVTAGGSGRGIASLLRRHFEGQLPNLRSRYAVPEVRPFESESAAAALFREFERLAGQINLEVVPVGFADLYERSPLADRLVVAAEAFERPVPIEELSAPTRAHVADHGRFVLNADHPIAERLVRVAEREPEWAALSLVKLICGPNLSVDEETDLVDGAIRKRRQREGERA
ncbi:MAG: hypothetical protein ABEN55_14365, partial [Bradymonadaceae bacterium]